MSEPDRTIWKFEVPIDDDEHVINSRFGLLSPIIHVALTPSQDSINFWTEVFTSGNIVRRVFRSFGTGFTLPPEYEHRGSVRNPDGILVWHLYELTGPRSWQLNQ